MIDSSLIDAIGAVGLNLLVGVLAAAIYFLYRVFRHDSRYKLIVNLVEAAEQMMGDAPGPERLEWVLEQVKEHLPALNPALVRAIIEAAVFRINRAKQAITES